MKKSQIFGIIMAISLIVFSLVYPVPEKYVYVSSSSKAYDYSWSENKGAEYLGGDCYNYQVEASLKAGYFCGVLVMKSITFVGGILLFFLTMYSRIKCICLAEIKQAFTQLYINEEAQKKILEKLAAKEEKEIEE